MKKLFFLVLITLISGFVNAQKNTGIKEMLNLRYGIAEKNTLDLFLPENYDVNTPVIILLHGGAWMMGGKEYTDKTAKDLCHRGFVVANIDYRYVSDDVHADDLTDDIHNSVQFVKEKGEFYHFSQTGYHIAGISAGAHLALLYGYTKGEGIRSVTALCPPTKLDDPAMMSVMQNHQLVKNVELLADAKYIPDEKINPKFTAISPYSHIRAVPTLLFHGDKDDLVPELHSKFLFKELQKRKIISKFVPMIGKGHDCGMNQPESEKKVLDEIERWIRKYN